jgi:phosphoribosylanthranilate isomerase
MTMAATEVKICGLTNFEDAKACLELGADYLGFVIYPDSPRGIDASAFRRIVDRLEGAFRAVGVFVNADREDVETLARDCGLHAVQLHGQEEPAEFVDIPVTVWRAVRVGGSTCLPDPADWPAARYVVDAHVPGLYGGTGVRADWRDAAELAARYPVMLAGGLTPENVADGVQAVHPLGVDTASGVEHTPGRKDLEKVAAFIRHARSGI